MCHIRLHVCRNSILRECEDETHTPKMRTWETSGTKNRSDATPAEWWREYYIGEGVDFQKFRVRLQGSKHLTLGIFLNHWKAIKV